MTEANKGQLLSRLAIGVQGDILVRLDVEA